MLTIRQLSICLFFAFIFNPIANAQKGGGGDQPTGIFGTQKEYYQFMGNAKRVAYGPEGSKELQAMIPMLNDIALNQPIGTTAGNYKTEASTLGLLSDKNIRSEIEMVDEQYNQLRKANDRIQARVAEEIRGLDFSKVANMTTRIKSIRERAKKELDEVLLPHQLKRLRQLHLQSKLQRESLVDVLAEEPFKSELEISNEQVDDLRKEEEKLQEELEREIQKLRAESREKLLAKLKPKQEERAKDLLGDTFEFKESEESDRKKSGKRRVKK